MLKKLPIPPEDYCCWFEEVNPLINEEIPPSFDDPEDPPVNEPKREDNPPAELPLEDDPPVNPPNKDENPLPALCPPIRLSSGLALSPPPKSPFAVSKNPATPVFFYFPRIFLTNGSIESGSKER